MDGGKEVGRQGGRRVWGGEETDNQSVRQTDRQTDVQTYIRTERSSVRICIKFVQHLSH